MKKRTWLVAGVSTVLLCGVPAPAHAEQTLAKPAQGWEVYTSGRVGAFVELVQGRGLPAPLDANHPPTTDEGIQFDSADSNNGTPNSRGQLLASRVRSGFLGNILSLGVRNHLTENTTVTAQISLWSAIESLQQRTYQKNVVDAREGYLKVEGPAGTLLAGRALSLFGRGATEIDFLYGHGFGVGAPSGFNDQGPSAGHIGFGVLANVFAAGVSYATPRFNGFDLTIGYYDPAQLVGVQYSRTKFGRPEASATYDAKFGEANNVHLFLEGAFQKLYDTNGSAQSKTVYGGQAGGRIALGAFRLGVAAFSGKGLGVNYFLNQVTSITNNATSDLRPFDGGYVQAQVVVNKFNFNAGAGITRAHQMTQDLDLTLAGNQPSYLKSHRGLSAVVVYHFSDYLHGALDYFRADTNWWGGETQGVNAFNAGMTVTW